MVGFGVDIGLAGRKPSSAAHVKPQNHRCGKAEERCEPLALGVPMNLPLSAWRWWSTVTKCCRASGRQVHFSMEFPARRRKHAGGQSGFRQLEGRWSWGWIAGLRGDVSRLARRRAALLDGPDGCPSTKKSGGPRTARPMIKRFSRSVALTSNLPAGLRRQRRTHAARPRGLRRASGNPARPARP